MIEKILVPLDGSDLAELALTYIVELEKSINAEVHLVHVCNLVEKEYRNLYSKYLEQVSEGLRSSLHGLNPQLKVYTVVIDGQPDTKILDYALENNINLIVLVSHGHSGIMLWSTGSIAAKIMQKSTIPVLLIRAADSVRIKTASVLFGGILVPLDGSTTGETALLYVKEIAVHTKSEIILLRVLEQVQHVHTIGGIDHFIYTDQQVDQMKQEAIVYLNEVKQKLITDGLTVKTIIKIGDIAKEIIDTTIQENVDVVAMSSHGKSGAIQWVLGSVSNKILQAGKKPLLLVRPSDKS